MHLCVIEYMGKEPSADVPEVTRFVREVIGCNCPDEVFRHIEIQHGSSAVKACPADCELRIGGRLLIVVTSEPLVGGGSAQDLRFNTQSRVFRRA